MPYAPAHSKRSSRTRAAPPPPSALATLLHTDPSLPHHESSTGLGAAPDALASSRAARAVRRYTEFEEDNFTRLVMKKRDVRRRAREEEALALGGSVLGGGARTRGAAGVLEGEFADVLRDVGRVAVAKGGAGDGYEELRRRSKKGDVLERSRVRAREETFADDGRPPKKGRFEKATRAIKHKAAKAARKK
jgi:U3 small nucleolar ribonucleoprotein protein LCP5